MIYFTKFGSYGRLGNQLFQYAAIRSLSLARGYKISLPILDNKIFHGQKNLIKNLSIPEHFFKKQSFFKKLLLKKYVEKNPKVIDQNFFAINDNTDFIGYFQSLYYFQDYVDIIKKELTPKKKFLLNARDKITEIKSKYPGYQIVSLHIRRGDNVDINIKGNSKNLLSSFGDGDFKNSTVGKYIYKAIQHFNRENVKFLLFSGGNRFEDNNYDDIQWCKTNIKNDHIIFNNPDNSFSDFCLIMNCDHNIISMSSSFGWWAAFLNRNPNKIVIAPQQYNLSDDDPSYNKMFYPKDWTII